MAENQNVEFKETWKDEYLKWVCGFANAQGGRIYIGVRDNGDIIGLSNSRKLLVDIPNKIKNTLGIIPEVNLRDEFGKEYIEIKIKQSSYHVDYRGEYYKRSGSTNQQISGAALREFLADDMDNHWDAIPVDNITVEELDKESIDIFRRESVKNGRMLKEEIAIPNEELLDRLHLFVKGKLKRAALMLFYREPSRIISGCYVKIGKFGEGADLQYQDILEGSLFYIADRVIDLIYTKYLKAAITYEKDVRVETYPFPREGVREAIYNALGHNNFAQGVPIQIRIEDDAMYISNSGILPKDWTTKTLMQRHRSNPFNPSIANVFYRAGYIEAWGRGIQKICESCRELGIPDPEYTVLGDDITVKFTALATPKTSNRHDVGLKVGYGIPETSIISHSVHTPKTSGNRVPKHQADVLGDVLADKILTALSHEATLTQKELAERLSVSLPSVQRAINKLKSNGRIVRKSGKRYGYWEVKN